jgi:hypothetical protein
VHEYVQVDWCRHAHVRVCARVHTHMYACVYVYGCMCGMSVCGCVCVRVSLFLGPTLSQNMLKVDGAKKNSEHTAAHGTMLSNATQCNTYQGDIEGLRR